MISAVRSPTSRLYLRLMYATIASSILSPATRIDFATTMAASEMTATSGVPAPLSTIMVPGEAHRLRAHDARARDRRSVGRPAADVDDHVARRLGHGQARADRRRHRLL